MFVGAAIEPLGCGRTIGAGLSSECAALMTQANVSSFYDHTLPKVAAASGGYALLGMLTVRSARSRLKLVIAAALFVAAFGILARPLPVPPILGT